MYCSSCGKQISDIDVFCRHCGKRLSGVTTASNPVMNITPNPQTINDLRFIAQVIQQIEIIVIREYEADLEISVANAQRKPPKQKYLDAKTYYENQKQTVCMTPGFKSKVQMIPIKYRTSEAVNKFADYFENYRANNLQEAINLYETELHRNTLERNQASSLAIQQKQLACQRSMEAMWLLSWFI